MTSSVRPPLWALFGTVVFRSPFLSAGLILVPHLLTRWQVAPPLFDGELSPG